VEVKKEPCSCNCSTMGLLSSMPGDEPRAKGSAMPPMLNLPFAGNISDLSTEIFYSLSVTAFEMFNSTRRYARGNIIYSGIVQGVTWR